MVMATGVEWLSEPDVPVTVKVTWDAGVWPFELLAHPRANIETKSSKPSTLVHIMPLRVSGFRLRVARAVPNSPRPGSRVIMPYKLYPVTGGGVETKNAGVPGADPAAVPVIEDDAEDADGGREGKGLRDFFGRGVETEK